MKLHSMIAATVIALGAGTAALPAYAQSTHSINVWGARFDVPDHGAGGILGGMSNQNTAIENDIGRPSAYASSQQTQAVVNRRHKREN
jgi:hypothetical protein